MPKDGRDGSVPWTILRRAAGTAVAVPWTLAFLALGAGVLVGRSLADVIGQAWRLPSRRQPRQRDD